MPGKIFLTLLVLLGGMYIAYRFGLLGNNIKPSPNQTEIVQNFQNIPSPFPSTSILGIENTSSPSAIIRILSASTSASLNQKVTIQWSIQTNTTGSLESTAIRYGPVSKSNPQLTSDYPEKSLIQKGQIPATFSAQLRFASSGDYFYRAHAVINNQNIWSDEKKITVFDSTPSAIIH